MTVEPDEAVAVSIEFVVPPGKTNSIGYYVGQFVKQMQREGVAVTLRPTPDDIDTMLADVQRRMTTLGVPPPPDVLAQIERIKALNRFRHRVEAILP